MTHRIENMVIDAFLSVWTALFEAFIFGVLLFLVLYGVDHLGGPWTILGWPLTRFALFFPPLWFLWSWFGGFRRRQRRRIEHAPFRVTMGP